MTGYGEFIHERRSPYDIDQALDNHADFSFADHEAEQAPYPADAPAPPESGAGAPSSTPASSPSAGRVEEPAADDTTVVPITGRRAPGQRAAPTNPDRHERTFQEGAIRAALDIAWTSYLEGDEATALHQLGFVSRLLRGRVA